jgi:YcxB-like protein
VEIEYQLTPEDLFAFQWRAAYMSPKSRRLRRRPYLYLFLAFLLIALLPAIGSSGFVIARVNLVLLVVIFPLVSGLYWVLQRQMLRRAIHGLVGEEKADKGQLGTHTIALSEQGLVERTAVGESRTSWAGVDRVEQNDDYIFIYTSPIAAHLIPKRAFAGSQAQEFVDFALEQKRHADMAAS